LLDRAFATAARADVWRTGLGISADAGDEHEAGDTGSGRRPCERLGASLVHGFERYAGGLDIGGNGVDDGVGSGDGGGDRGLLAHVGTEDHNPVQARRSQSAARAVGISDRNAHRRSSGGESLDETPTEEAGAAKHTDHGHGIPFRMLDKIDPNAAFHVARRWSSKCLIRIVCDPPENYQRRTRVRSPQSKRSSFVEIIGSLSGRNSAGDLVEHGANAAFHRAASAAHFADGTAVVASASTLSAIEYGSNSIFGVAARYVRARTYHTREFRQPLQNGG